jgi:hypothetical protein
LKAEKKPPETAAWIGFGGELFEAMHPVRIGIQPHRILRGDLGFAIHAETSSSIRKRTRQIDLGFAARRGAFRGVTTNLMPASAQSSATFAVSNVRRIVRRRTCAAPRGSASA